MLYDCLTFLARNKVSLKDCDSLVSLFQKSHQVKFPSQEETPEDLEAFKHHSADCCTTEKGFFFILQGRHIFARGEK